MYRYTTPRILNRLAGFCIWQMDRSKKEVYLTFDDGPHPEITPWVLDLLDVYSAKATFFCVGNNVKKYPSIYSRLLDDGHQVGNHTTQHLNGWRTNNREYLRDVQDCGLLVKSTLFRPPYGRISPIQALHLKKQKYTLVMWSLLSRDFEQSLNTSEAVRQLVKNTENGSIIVFHDSQKAAQNLKNMLPAYLQACSQAGYSFVALP